MAALSAVASSQIVKSEAVRGPLVSLGLLVCVGRASRRIGGFSSWNLVPAIKI